MLSQLRAKHPPRPAPVKLPSMGEIEAERASWQEELYVEEDLDSKLEVTPEEPDDDGRPADQSSSFPFLVINGRIFYWQ